MSRPIDADALEKDGWMMHRTVRVDKNTMSYQTKKPTDFHAIEPEIIRCKECKHRDPEDKKCDCGHDILWQLPRQDDWYCADAERAERRTDE